MCLGAQTKVHKDLFFQFWFGRTRRARAELSPDPNRIQQFLEL